MSETPDSPSPQQPAGVPQQVVVVHEKRGNGMAVAGFVTGLLGAIFGLIPILFWLSFPLGVLGIVFGFIGWRRAKADPARGGKGLAIAGLVLGIIGVILAIIGVVIIDNALSDLE